MRTAQVAIAGLFAAVTNVAIAQTPADNLVGTWVNAQSGYCGKSVVVVTRVEENGIVRGTFICERTGWRPVMGDRTDRNAVKGTFTGTRFVMENAEGGGFDLTVEGGTANGHGRARASMAPNPSTYTKQ